MTTPWKGPALTLALALGGALATAAAAQAQATEAPGAASQTTAAAPTLPGRRVMRDAVTGELRGAEHDEVATPAETARSAASSAGSAAASAAQQRRAQTMERFRKLTAVTGFQGAKGQRLDASHMNFSVVQRNADGTLTQDCVVGEAAASAALNAPASNGVKPLARGEQAKEDSHAH